MEKIVRGWCEEFVIAVIISLIIEMLLPEGNNKKYVKVIIGIYIIFVMINPIFELINYRIDFKEILNTKSIEVSSSTSNYIDDIRIAYIDGLKNTIKEDILNLGYKVDYINLEFNMDYTNIEKIELKILGKIKIDNTIYNVEPVIIGSEAKSEFQYDEIKKFLSEKYLIVIDNIFIN